MNLPETGEPRKRCTKCGTVKLLSEFRETLRFGQWKPLACCRLCERAAVKARAHKYAPVCVDCGKATQGTSTRCRVCGARAKVSNR